VLSPVLGVVLASSLDINLTTLSALLHPDAGYLGPAKVGR
jgi:hypothetical protein